MKKGWEVKKIADVCDIKTGKKDVNQGNPNGKYPFFTCAKEHTFSDSYSFDMEALLIAGNGDVGNVNYYKGKFEAYQRTYILYNFKNILPSFLFCILDGFLKQTVSKQKLGNTMPYIKMGMLTDFEIPLPPLPEQKRIVAVLDESFAALAKAKENAEKNLENAKELFESVLQDIFNNPKENWEDKKFGEICEYDKTPYKKNNLPYIGLEDIESNTGKFIGSTDPKKVKSNTFYFTNKHILYGRLRPYLNKVLLPSFDGHCSTEIFPIIPKDNLYRGYVFYWLIYGGTVKKINATWTGARMPRANMNAVLDFEIPLPKISEQHEIVEKLGALSDETKKLETIYQQKLSDLDELKKSLLQKAFNGEL